MTTDENHRPPAPVQPDVSSEAFVRQVVDARHDLRNPLAHILGFTEMLVEKAAAQNYNFLKSRLQMIGRLADELVTQVNGCLEPEKIRSGASDIAGLRQQLHRDSARIISAAESLAAKEIVRRDAEFSADLARIAGSARQLAKLADSTLAVLPKPALPEVKPARVRPRNVRRGTEAEKPARVLVADHDPECREQLKGWLAALAHTAVLAENGQQVLDTLSQEPADLVLLDLHFMDSDGGPMLLRLKQAPVLRSIPVVVMVADGELAEAIRCIELGAADYLPKPVSPVLLKVRVESALASKKPRA